LLLPSLCETHKNHNPMCEQAQKKGAITVPTSPPICSAQRIQAGVASPDGTIRVQQS
jgi:hypothetical protein